MKKMKKYLNYLPYVLAGILFFAGRCSMPAADKDLIKKYELERKTLLEDVKVREARIIDRDKEAATIVQKMKEDHARDSVALKANNEAYLKLKRKYNEINLSRADAHVLDSLVSGLYPD